MEIERLKKKDVVSAVVGLSGSESCIQQLLTEEEEDVAQTWSVLQDLFECSDIALLPAEHQVKALSTTERKKTSFQTTLQKRNFYNEVKLPVKTSLVLNPHYYHYDYYLLNNTIHYTISIKKNDNNDGERMTHFMKMTNTMKMIMKNKNKKKEEEESQQCSNTRLLHTDFTD